MLKTLQHHHIKYGLGRVRKLVAFLYYLIHRFFNENCTTTAASLTFTTLLALIPLLTIGLTLFSAFPAFSEYSIKFKAFILANLVPDASGKIISVYLRQFSDNAGKLTALGLGGLAVTAILLMFTIEDVFNHIWGVPKARKLLSRTLIYWTVLTLGPLLIGMALSVSTILFGQHGILSSIPILGWLLSYLGWLTFNVLGLALLYAVVPNCYVPPRHAFIAAVIIALLLQGMQTLFTIYIKQFATYTLIYGAFASFPILLLWLYLYWSIILFGAILSATLSYWNKGDWQAGTKTRTELEGAVNLLIFLDKTQRVGNIAKVDLLYRQLGLGTDQIQQILGKLAQKKLVQPTQDGGWVLAVPLEQIHLHSLFSLFVYQLPPAHHPLLHEVYARISDTLEVDLQTLAQRADTTQHLDKMAPSLNKEGFRKAAS
jgi:membrane protein